MSPCPHGIKYATKCAICSGCTHNVKFKSSCIVCSPHLFCVHKKARSKCKLCKDIVCQHGHRWNRCKIEGCTHIINLIKTTRHSSNKKRVRITFTDELEEKDDSTDQVVDSTDQLLEVADELEEVADELEEVTDELEEVTDELEEKEVREYQGRIKRQNAFIKNKRRKIDRIKYEAIRYQIILIREMRELYKDDTKNEEYKSLLVKEYQLYNEIKNILN